MNKSISFYTTIIVGFAIISHSVFAAPSVQISTDKPQVLINGQPLHIPTGQEAFQKSYEKTYKATKNIVEAPYKGMTKILENVEKLPTGEEAYQRSYNKSFAITKAIVDAPLRGVSRLSRLLREAALRAGKIVGNIAGNTDNAVDEFRDNTVKSYRSVRNPKPSEKQSEKK